MRTLEIGGAEFVNAFGRDLRTEAEPQTVYLHLATGNVVWTYDSDDDAPGEQALEGNRETREWIAANRDQFFFL